MSALSPPIPGPNTAAANLYPNPPQQQLGPGAAAVASVFGAASSHPTGLCPPQPQNYPYREANSETKVPPKKKKKWQWWLLLLSNNKNEDQHPDNITTWRRRRPHRTRRKHQTGMAIPRSNALSLPRGAEVSEIPFPQREGRNFDAATTIAFHLLFRKLKLGKNWLSIVVYISILIVLFYLLPWTVLCRTSKLLFAHIFLVITILMKWQKMDCFGWHGMDTVVKFVFVSLCPLSTVPLIILSKIFKKITGTVLILLPILTCVRLRKSMVVITTIKSYKHSRRMYWSTQLNCVPMQKYFSLEKKSNQYAVTAFSQ